MGRRLASAFAVVALSGALIAIAAVPASAEVVCEPGSDVIPYGQVYQDDPNSDVGVTYVVQGGVNGSLEYENCTDTENPDGGSWRNNLGQTDPVSEVIAVGSRQPSPANPSSNNPPTTTNNTRPSQAPTETVAPVETPTPTPTPTPVELGDIELEPTYYDVQPSSGQNLLATGALAGAIIMTCAVVVGAIFYRRFLRDRLKYRGR